MGNESDVRNVFVAAVQRSLPGASQVANWLLINAREFAAELSKIRRPNWHALAQALHDTSAIGSPKGGPVTGETLRVAWYRVRVHLDERGGADWVKFAPAPKQRKARGMRKEPRPITATTRDPASPSERAHQANGGINIDDVLRQAAAMKTWLK